jgi:hypothetical protein
MYKGSKLGVPQVTDLFFNYSKKGWTHIGTFKSKYAAKLYAYEHGHDIASYDSTWKIEATSYLKAKQDFEAKQSDKRNEWVNQAWYNFYTEKYGEDLLK